MTIIAILIALAVNHFLKGVRHLRRFDWLPALVRLLEPALEHLRGAAAPVGAALVLAIPLLVLALLDFAIGEWLGHLLHYLFVILVLVYCIGPRDLDIDVNRVVGARNEEELQDAARPLLDEPLREDVDERCDQFTSAVFREGLFRWFAVIFWFALLGIYGALAYRLAAWIADHADGLDEQQVSWLRRLRAVLEWPAAQLMTLALAIAADFDTVFATWRRYHNEQGYGLSSGRHGFMLAAAVEAVRSGHAARDGFADQLTGRMGPVRLAMDLLWRVLAVWLTILALMLLAGWLA